MNEFTKRQQDKDISRRDSGGKCKLCTGALTLPKTKLRDLYNALIDRKIETVVILDVLDSWGIETSKTAIINHRNGKHGTASHMEMLRERVK